MMDYEILIRFLLALLWGGIVGVEREYRGKSAGFRTLIMISLGSCFFTIMSVFIGGSNPDRIAANIVTGIGFLGAGVIFKGENRVNGITTAATIWAVAAVGMGIGAGFYFAAACACVLILFVLAILPYVEKMIDLNNHTKEYIINCDFSENATRLHEELMQHFHLKYRITKQIKEGNNLYSCWQVQGSTQNHQQFINAIHKLPFIKRFEY